MGWMLFYELGPGAGNVPFHISGGMFAFILAMCCAVLLFIAWIGVMLWQEPRASVANPPPSPYRLCARIAREATMAEPTKWAQKVAQVIYANMFDDTGNPLAPKEAVDQVALALDEAHRQGIEEAARIADGARELVELRGEIGFVTPHRFAEDLAKDIADGIRALATKEPTDGFDEARRQGIARLADPDDALLDRGLRVVAMAAAAGHITRVQMHDICQALADELEATDD